MFELANYDPDIWREAMSDEVKTAEEIVNQWDQHDQFRDFEKEGEPPEVKVARAYLALMRPKASATMRRGSIQVVNLETRSSQP